MTQHAAQTLPYDPRQTLHDPARCFEFAVQPTIAPSLSDGKARERKFSGVAYSGQMIPSHWFWGNVIFDLSTMSMVGNGKLPALIDHDNAQRAGYATSSRIDEQGLVVEGVLMKTAAGQQVADESDQGFPWQMSVRITPGSVEEVAAGVSVSVNNQTLAGPLTIFRNSTVSEVSFTATGWDANTSAAAMSRGGTLGATTTSRQEGDTSMNQPTQQAPAPAQAPAQAPAVDPRAAALEAENAQLKAQVQQFAAAARTAEIQSLFAAIGREYKADSDDVKKFSALPADAFALTASLLREQAAAKPSGQQTTPPANLFSHVAAEGRNGETPAGTDPAANANPLLGDAQRRAKEFAQQRDHGRPSFVRAG